MEIVDYRIIVRSCTDVLPIAVSILKLFLVIIFLYSGIGFLLFGGMINSETLEQLEEHGIEMDPDFMFYSNFNDFLNSFIYYFFASINGGYIFNVHLSMVLAKIRYNNNVMIVLYRFYGYSFLIIAEFGVMFILFTFVGGLIGIY